MDESEIILKVQAFVDGELSEAQQSEIAALIARDPDVHALVKEMKQTRQALVGFEEGLELPEPADFHWSKIRREIDQLPQRGPVARSEPSPLRALLVRWLMPAGALAALALIATWMFLGRGGGPVGGEVAWTADSDEVNAFTYRDYDEGMTLVWLSYAADNAVADPGEPATIN